MGNYLRIATVYMRWPAAAVWLFMLLGLGGIAGTQIGGGGARKTYVAMFVYVNAGVLGVLLRDNIAHPWASVLPHYRKKHLLVTTVIALLCIGIPIFAMMFVDTNDIAPTSIAVIFLTCLAAGLCYPFMG